MSVSPARPGVLVVTGAYFPELSGGGLQAKAIVDTLRDDIRFTVLTTCTDAALPIEDRVEGTPVHRVFVDAASARSKMAAAWAMARAFLARASSIDIVHLHGFSQKTVLLVCLARLARQRIVLTLHTAGQDEPDAVARHGRLAAWAYAQADRYLAVSEPLAESLRRHGVAAERIVRVSNGLDLRRFRPAAEGERDALRRSLGLPLDAVLILFAGFFSRDKGPHILFEAWRRIAGGAAAGSSLVFVGATESRYYEVDAALAAGIRDTAAAEGLAGRIVFAGETRTIEDYFRAADLFVFPTRREAFGMTLVEAMASGLPCIAARIPGVTDAIVSDGESGLLFEPDDVEGLSGALARVLGDRVLASRLGRAARAAVEPRFAIERTALLTRDVYLQVLAGTGAAAVPR